MKKFRQDTILFHMRTKVHRFVKFVLSFLLLTMVAAAVLPVSGNNGNTSSSVEKNSRIILLSEQFTPPLAPAEPDSGKHPGSLRGAEPALPAPALISRRNQEPLSLRCFRDGNAGFVRTELELSAAYPTAENGVNPLRFDFQVFLQRSLPPRAGPYTV